MDVLDYMHFFFRMVCLGFVVACGSMRLFFLICVFFRGAGAPFGYENKQTLVKPLLWHAYGERHLGKRT